MKAKAQGTPLYSLCWDSHSLPLCAMICPRADSGSLILICSQRDAASESTVDVQEFSNKSFLIVKVEPATQTYIRKTGKSLLEILVIPQFSGKSNRPWVKSLRISCPLSFSLIHSRYLSIPLNLSDGNSSSLRWRYHLPPVARNDGLGHPQKGVL